MFEAFDHLVCLIHVVCWPDPPLDGKHSEIPSGNSIKKSNHYNPHQQRLWQSIALVMMSVCLMTINNI